MAAARRSRNGRALRRKSSALVPAFLLGLLIALVVAGLVLMRRQGDIPDEIEPDASASSLDEDVEVPAVVDAAPSSGTLPDERADAGAPAEAAEDVPAPPPDEEEEEVVAKLDVPVSFPESVPGLKQVTRESLAPRPLRGYGKLGGEYVSFTNEAGASSSCLLIRCENVEKAKIVHAKYQSDLRLLEGVEPGKLDVGGFSVPVDRVQEQGSVASARSGGDVYVLAARDEKDLAALAAATKLASARGVEFTPAGKVPMFLDSFDRFGFRFYLDCPICASSWEGRGADRTLRQRGGLRGGGHGKAL